MIIALRAKSKLSFVNGKITAPANAPTLEKWQQVDSMVISWILNSSLKELVEAFLYAAISHELWTELEQRFGESNGPLLYQIKRDISTFSQGNSPLAVYYTKLKKL